MVDLEVLHRPPQSQERVRIDPLRGIFVAMFIRHIRVHFRSCPELLFLVITPTFPVASKLSSV